MLISSNNATFERHRNRPKIASSGVGQNIYIGKITLLPFAVAFPLESGISGFCHLETISSSDLRGIRHTLFRFPKFARLPRVLSQKFQVRPKVKPNYTLRETEKCVPDSSESLEDFVSRFAEAGYPALQGKSDG